MKYRRYCVADLWASRPAASKDDGFFPQNVVGTHDKMLHIYRLAEER